MSLSTLRYSTPIYKEAQCWYNAASNIKHYRLQGKNLHLVLGAHAYITDPNNLNPRTAQFNGIYPTSKNTWEVKENEIWAEPAFSHGWLEDENGNVYDYIYKGRERGIIEGESKKSLATRGLHYCHLSPLTEMAVYKHILEQLVYSAKENEKEKPRLLKHMAEGRTDLIVRDQEGGEMTLTDSLLEIEQVKINYKQLQEAWMARKGN